jgi:hypothetical protein
MKINANIIAGALSAGILAIPLAQGHETMNMKLVPEEVIAGFDGRVDAMFRSESGKPLVRAKKNPPLGPGRGPYVRGYSYSIMAFAARCLYLNEKIEEANAALVENAQYYLDNPLAISDRDSFHWHADIVLRLLEMYGPKGSVKAGLLTKETEAKLLEYMWIYTRKCSWLGKAEYEKTKTWNVYSSENHHAMDFTCHWHFAKYAKDRPEYRELKCVDGSTLAQQYEAWNAYFVEYCRERARRGICVEMRSDGYNSTLIKGFYNFYDFGNADVKRAAGMILDLYFAYWAEEQIMGHMGGGASRIKGNNAFVQSRNHGNAVLAWLYFAIGEQPELGGHDIGALTSAYRPPAVIVDIARDTEGRGTYEIRQRVQGLGKQGHTFPHMDKPDQQPNQFRTDGGGILRYSYCTPAFILGTPMVEARPFSDWVMISSQSRWQGVIFAGEGDPRIVPVPRAMDNLVCFNQFWSVQSKGSLITQKLVTNKGAAEMMVWMSKKGLSKPVEEDGVVFVEAPGAYAAIRLVKGEFTLSERLLGGTKEEKTSFTSPPGYIMTPADEYAPVILEVISKPDAASLDAFKNKVKATRPVMKGSILSYKTIYGDTLTLDTSYKQIPTINGKPVDYAPKKVFDSPFLNADYNSGVVTIGKGERKRVLDFNELSVLTPGKDE